jgi:hypothetical protein
VRILALLSLALPLLIGGAPRAAAQDSSHDWTIRAGRVYTAAGDPLDGGSVAVSGGKITAVSTGKGGGGDDLLECAAGPPPGLIATLR